MAQSLSYTTHRFHEWLHCGTKFTLALTQVLQRDVSRHWDGLKFVLSKTNGQRPSHPKGFLNGGKYLNAAPPRCDEGYIWQCAQFSSNSRVPNHAALIPVTCLFDMCNLPLACSPARSFHGFKPWNLHAWFTRLRAENANGVQHDGADGIPPLWERVPPHEGFCDRCFLVKVAHIIAAWDNFLVLSKKMEYDEVIAIVEQQTEPIEAL